MLQTLPAVAEDAEEEGSGTEEEEGSGTEEEEDVPVGEMPGRDTDGEQEVLPQGVASAEEGASTDADESKGLSESDSSSEAADSEEEYAGKCQEWSLSEVKPELVLSYLYLCPAGFIEIICFFCTTSTCKTLNVGTSWPRMQICTGINPRHTQRHICSGK